MLQQTVLKQMVLKRILLFSSLTLALATAQSPTLTVKHETGTLTFERPVKRLIALEHRVS